MSLILIILILKYLYLKKANLEDDLIKLNIDIERSSKTLLRNQFIKIR